MKWPRFKTDGHTGVIAHIERYLPFHNSDALQALRAQGSENARQRFVLFKLEDKTKSSEDAAARRD